MAEVEQPLPCDEHQQEAVEEHNVHEQCLGQEQAIISRPRFQQCW